MHINIYYLHFYSFLQMYFQFLSSIIVFYILTDKVVTKASDTLKPQKFPSEYTSINNPTHNHTSATKIKARQNK